MTRPERFLVVVASTLALGLAAQGRAQPSAGAGGVDLLTVAPFDRMTLIDGAILDIEPLTPRPLPPYDPAKEAKKKRTKKEAPEGGNIGLPGEKTKVVEPDDEEETSIAIHLLQGDVRDFKVKRSAIKGVQYFEDALLAEGERFLAARDYTRAFECYLKVRARDASWRGLDEHVNNLLFAEGNTALLDGDGERGLRLLGELFARKPDFPGLADKLAASYATRASRALELGLFARGRKILHDVEPLAPNHPLLREVRERFIGRARGLVKAAESSKGAEKVDALAGALRVWPTLEGAEDAYRKAFAATPTLDVAVLDVPRDIGPWVRSLADERVSRLLYRPVLERDDDASFQGQPASQLAAKVATADLGRRIVITLRPDISWSDGSRPVASIDVARALTDMAEPTSARFSARWADLLDRVDATDATTVEVRLTRAALKPGAWLLGPVGPVHGGSDGRVALGQGRRELVGDGPFRVAGVREGRVELRAIEASGSEARPASTPVRVVETRYADARQALGAFRRGEVAVLEHVPPSRVERLAEGAEMQVGRYVRPSLHAISLDGRNLALRNRNLRRGMAYGIDRKTLLEEAVLGRAADAENLVSDGPFPKGNYADAPEVKPFVYNPVLARMLIAAAKKELGDVPLKFTFEYPAISEAQAVVPRIVEAFQRLDVTLTPVERPASELENELHSGRKFDLAYRATRCDESVIDAGPLITPAYDAPPSTNPLGSLTSPRILQLLLQLERAPEWPTARGIVVQIDRECRDELPTLPLWQVVDHYAWRTRLKGPKAASESLYDGLTSWEIEPWFAKDSW